MIIDLAGILLAGIFGFFLATIAAMIGISGGFITVAFLMLVFELGPSVAAGTSLFAIVFMSLSATSGFFLQQPRPINFQVGVLFMGMTAMGSLVGTTFKNSLADPSFLSLLITLIVIPSILKMTILPKKEKRDFLPQQFIPKGLSDFPIGRLVLGGGLALLTGFTAGISGIGGGTLMVPTLSIIVGLPMHAAVATSSFIMMATSVAGSFNNVTAGSVQLDIALALSVGLLLGVQLGVRIMQHIKSKYLSAIFGAMMVYPVFEMSGIAAALANGDLVMQYMWIVALGTITNIALFCLRLQLSTPQDTQLDPEPI